MRILQAFEPPDGGVPEHVLQLALGLGAHGFEVELAGPISSQIYARAQASGIKVHPLPMRRDYGHPRDDFRAAVKLLKLLRAGNYQLVHCHSSKAGALGRAMASLSSIPAIYTPHGFGFIGDVRRARKVAARAIERTLSPLTARIICLSRDEVQVARKARIARSARLALVYHGMPASHDHPPRDSALAAFRGDGRLIADIGVFREEKRHDVFLRAAALAIAREPSLRIALVGSGPLEARLRALAEQLRLDGESRFAFLPFEPPVERYLAYMDVMVLSSDREVLPISLLEALAWGIPQIATNVTGAREIVTPATGMLVPRRDPEALAAAMIHMIRDCDRAALANASRERHAELFTVDRMLGATAGVYRQALSTAAKAHHLTDGAGQYA